MPAEQAPSYYIQQNDKGLWEVVYINQRGRHVVCDSFRTKTGAKMRCKKYNDKPGKL